MQDRSEPVMVNDIRDCLIIGGGPAGLTAAIYLARFHLSVTLIDAGQSRAGLIPLTRNHAGFPEGIAGTELIERMRHQAMLYGVVLQFGTIDKLDIEQGGFLAGTTNGEVRACSVLLATGVVNRRPPMMNDSDHAEALADGRLRYCPICDGYEVTDLRVAVLGAGERARDEALFLRSYTANLTLAFPDETDELTEEDRSKLTEAGIEIAGACRAIRLADGKIELELADATKSFDSLYPALGSDIRSELAAQVGAKLSDDGSIIVDAHQRTNVPGLYAAGDVVLGLDQISHAMGEGGVAATTIRNDLAQRTRLFR